MTHPGLAHFSTDGFDTVQVNTGVLSLDLLPELGGKLSSLKDLRTGREWLWRNPRLAYKRLPPGVSYIQEADSGGWDECFPSVAPCDYPSPPWAGAAIQDHGELWSQSAVLEVVESAGEVRLRTRWQGSILPYTFERTITLAAESATLRFEYAVTSRADEPLHFIWSAHPLLAIEPGMQLLLPPAARFNRWSSVPADLLAQDHGLRFPLSARGIDLTLLPNASAGIALKLWSNPLDTGWATLRARDGELNMHWDVALLPQVGFWMNLGAWAGDGGAPYYNLGLEPCIGAQDSLSDAVQRNLFAALPPHGARTWWLEVELGTEHVTQH
jgi:galactose mutarotase-like enzyme